MVTQRIRFWNFNFSPDQKCSDEQDTKDLKAKQEKDKSIVTWKDDLLTGKATKSIHNKFILAVDGRLYFLSYSDTSPTMRLHVPLHMHELVFKAFHDDKGHPGSDGIFDALKS